MPGTASLLVASNRGPVSFAEEADGTLSVSRGGGGLVSGLQSAMAGTDAVWVCAALSDVDRRAVRAAEGKRLDDAGHDLGGLRVRMLDIEPTTFHRAYNSVANATLWFVSHLLYDTSRVPVFDSQFAREWSAYERYNAAIADALAAEAADGATVVVQDYHLTLTPRQLRERRPDLRIGHFSHTPWAPPEYFRVLPDEVGRDVLLGILGADHAGFLSRRWADAFLDCCADVLDAQVDRNASTVTVEGRTTEVAVHALGVDHDDLWARARQSDVESRLTSLRERTAGLRTLLRIDRTELSKNIVRGLLAYRELLRTRPEWIGRVVHLALAYPSRHDLPEYREYTAAVQRVGSQIVEEFATDDWSPLRLVVTDDYPGSLAAFRMADVLVVNPIRDGMNLVAKEGPVLSEEGIALVLSREAGAADTLGDAALTVNPYDVRGTAEALDAALRMAPAERAERSARLAAAATALPPRAWFEEQVDALRNRSVT